MLLMMVMPVDDMRESVLYSNKCDKEHNVWLSTLPMGLLVPSKASRVLHIGPDRMDISKEIESIQASVLRES